MINILDKKECNGCCACIDACPVEAIHFVIDTEGFWYPEVDKQKCVDCSRCDAVCPELQTESPLLQVGEEPTCYAARHINKDIIKDSTSGGIFTAFAEAVFAKGGSVAGAVYREDFSVEHITTNNADDLPRLRSSKYLQSDCTGLYAGIKQRLIVGETVLVCGCPCQMAALRLSLEKDYENLVICDFICLGINSPKVFRKHLDSLENKHGSKIIYVKAKNKEHGWRSLTFKAVFEDGSSYYGDGRTDDFTRGYLHTGFYCRPSCFDCKFKKTPRIADLTVGDFWGIEKVAPSLDDNFGTSLVMCNTQKGRHFFDEIKGVHQVEQVTLSDIALGNRSLYKSIGTSQKGRSNFFNDLETMPFSQVALKHFPKSNTKLLRMKQILKINLQRALKFYQAMGHSPRAWFLFVWINFLRRNTDSNILKMHVIFPTKHCVFDIHPSAKITVRGPVKFGFSKVRGSKLETRIRLDADTELNFNDSFCVYAGADIQVFKGGRLAIDGGHSAGCNIHCQIICADNIEIGRNTLIGRNVVIRDYDAHYIIQKNYKVMAPIQIGSHCWIGEGSLISKGVKIKDGSIVAARSWVITNVEEKTLVAGTPAMPVKKDIEWEV